MPKTQTAFRLSRECLNTLFWLQQITGKNRTKLVHEAVKLYEETQKEAIKRKTTTKSEKLYIEIVKEGKNAGKQ